MIHYTPLGVMLFAISCFGYAEAQVDYNVLFDDANNAFVNGRFAEAIDTYDEILSEYPRNENVLRLKGIAQSNNDLDRESLITFYTLLQDNSHDAVALVGMGVGFGNFGEYKEAESYFIRALIQDPNSIVYQNYINFVDDVIAKYPYKVTQKPQISNTIMQTSIPSWVVNVTQFWGTELVSDKEFFSAMNYLLAERAVIVPYIRQIETEPEKISLVTENFRKSAKLDILDEAELGNLIQNMVRVGIFVPNPEDPLKREDRNKDDIAWFKIYLNKIALNVDKEKRYIEYPNPSGDVIKKFLRHYLKWNFEEEAKRASSIFPDPLISSNGGITQVHYNVFVNNQPSGLPLDHVSTLQRATQFWESQTLNYDQTDAKIHFNTTHLKKDANVWVTWVVRDLGDGVLGHANIGKGVVEVVLGDYNCDGSFQLYDIKTVLNIMTHEIGHSIGLGHSDDPDSIMYPSLSTSYAYCLL